jgi:CHAT domain-containing protein/tetratricopeptide (TPR) repeat protein
MPSRRRILVVVVAVATVTASGRPTRAGAATPAPSPSAVASTYQTAWQPPAAASTSFPAAVDTIRTLEARGAAGAWELVDALGSLGDDLLAAGAREAGVACYVRRLKVAEHFLGPGSALAGRCLNGLGETLWEVGDMAGARRNFELALAVREQALGPDDPAVAETLFNLGQVVLVSDNDTAAAKKIYERVIAILEKNPGPESPDMADALYAQSSVLRAEANFSGAVPLVERCLAIREKAFGPESPEAAEAITALATLATESGDLPAARRQAERALAIREKTLQPNDPALAMSLESVATVMHEQGDDAGALPMMRRALAIREKAQGPRHQELAGTIANLATILRSVGDLAGARALFERALVMHQELYGKDNALLAWDLMALGAVLAGQADYTAARPLLERAAAIQEKALGPEHPDLASTLANLGSLLALQGDLPAARPPLERSLAIREKALGPDHPLVGSSLNNLAVVARQQGDLATARALLSRALEIHIRSSGAQHPEVAAALQNLAAVCEAQKDTAAARSLLERSRAMWEKTRGPSHPAVTGSLLALARLDEASGNTRSAATLLRRALEIREKTLGPDHLDTAEAVLALGGFNWRQGKPGEARGQVLTSATIVDRAVGDLLPAMSVAEQRALLGKLLPAQTAWLLTTHRGGDDLARAYSVLFHWKGLLLEALRREGTLSLAAGGPQLQAVADRLHALRASIAGLYHRAGEMPAAEWRLELAELTTRKEATERELEHLARPDPLAERLATADLATFRTSLGRDEAFVDIYRTILHARHGGTGEEHYAAVVSGATGQPSLVDLGGATAIDRTVRAWRAHVLAMRPAGEQWRALATACWAPLARALPRGTSRVWIAPDGELNRIPWHLLPATASATASVLLTQADSAREVAGLTSPSAAGPAAPRTVFLAGGIDFEAGAGPGMTRGGDDYPPLPGTASEVAVLRDLATRGGLAVTLSTGAAADKAAVVKAIGAASFAHLATHGFFFREHPSDGARGAETEAPPANRNPLVESGLALAGANLRDATTEEARGLLTAEEIVGLDLSRCELLTLSACDTGRGEEITGQGVMGLRSACLAAGARSLVMSLWTVPDESTEKLMRAFYAGLWQEHLPPALALARAQEAVRDDPSGTFADPIHWAGWAIAGRGW